MAINLQTVLSTIEEVGSIALGDLPSFVSLISEVKEGFDATDQQSIDAALQSANLAADAQYAASQKVEDPEPKENPQE